MAISNGSSTLKTAPSRLYLLGWGIIALIAASYLGAMVFKPDLVEKSLGLPVINQESNQGTRSLSRALVELKALENKLRELKAENARLKSKSVLATGSGTTAEKSASSTPLDKPPTRPLVQRPAALGSSVGDKSDEAVASRSLPANGPTIAAGAADNPRSALPAAAAIAARFSNAADDGDGSGDTSIQGKIKPPAALNGVKLINGKTTPSGTAASNMPPLPERRATGRKTSKLGADAGAARKKGSQDKSFKTWKKLMVPKVDAYRADGGSAKPAASKAAPNKASTKKTAAVVAARKVAPTKIAVTKAAAPKITPKTGDKKTSNKTTSSQAGPKREAKQAARPAPVIRFGAPEVKRARAAAIALTTGPTLRVLQLNWLALKDRFGASLAALQPHYVVEGGRRSSRNYRLIAGPLRSGAEALQICSRLVVQGIACSVATLRGRRL